MPKTTAAMTIRCQSIPCFYFDAALERPAAREALVDRVPEADLVLSDAPAEEHLVPGAQRGKVDESELEILDDRAQRLDLAGAGDHLARALVELPRDLGVLARRLAVPVASRDRDELR